VPFLLPLLNREQGGGHAPRTRIRICRHFVAMGPWTMVRFQGRRSHRGRTRPRRDRRAHFGGFGSSWPAKDPKDRRYRRKPPATNPKNTPSRASGGPTGVRVMGDQEAGVGRTCHYARVERNAFTLVVRGSFISRLYSGDSTAISATLPAALL
jgi:hypothetical protein